MYFYSWTHDINDKRLFELNESSRRYGIKIEYLGSHLSSFTTTTVKVKLLYDRLCKLDDNEIVCAVDGFDVFFCGGADEIKQRFLSLNYDCVVSAERAYANQYKKYKNFYDLFNCESPYRYVNSGSIIGYAGALRKIYKPTLFTTVQSKIFTARVIGKIKYRLREIKRIFNLKKFGENSIYNVIYYTDQQHIGKYIAANPYNLKIGLDHYTKIFWCCAGECEDIDSHFRVEGGKIINNHTNNSPVIIHVPGEVKYRDILVKLFKTQQSLN